MMHRALLLLACSALIGLSQADTIDDLLMTPAEEEEERLSKEAMAEAMAADRGERQTDGTREEWDRPDDHAGKKYDSTKEGGGRRTLDERLHELLATNELECEGCTVRIPI
jgi:hypothetical protein